MAIPTYLPAPEQPGWPNLPDQGIPLVNAVATAESMRLKREEIQGKLAQAILRNQYLEQTQDLKERYFGLAQQGLEQRVEHANFMEGMAERKAAVEFVRNQPLEEFALAMFNLNAFLYVD